MTLLQGGEPGADRRPSPWSCREEAGGVQTRLMLGAAQGVPRTPSRTSKFTCAAFLRYAVPGTVLGAGNRKETRSLSS